MGGGFELSPAQGIDLGCGVVDTLGLESLRENPCDPGGPSAPSLGGQDTVWRILEGGELKPHRVRYDLERRDTDFERKRAEVWVVYRDASLNPPEAACDAWPRPIPAVRVDEKPGAQALGTSVPVW